MHFKIGPALSGTKRVSAFSLLVTLSSLAIISVVGCGGIEPADSAPGAPSPVSESAPSSADESADAFSGTTEGAAPMSMGGGGGGMPSPAMEAESAKAFAPSPSAGLSMEPDSSAGFARGNSSDATSRRQPEDPFAGDGGTIDEIIIVPRIAGGRPGGQHDATSGAPVDSTPRFTAQLFFEQAEQAEAGPTTNEAGREPANADAEQSLSSKAAGSEPSVRLNEFPLQSMQVQASVAENLALVEVQQSYVNSTSEAMNAVYQFDPGAEGAVTNFVMKIGSRQIRAIITDSDNALRLHEEATRQGLLASVMEEMPDGLLAVRVSNIRPHDSVEVEFSYLSRPDYRNGGYEFSFPEFVKTAASAESRAKTQPFQFSLDIQSAAGLESVQCVSHAATVERTSSQRCQVSLSPSGDDLCKPIIVRYTSSISSVQPVLMTDKDRHGEYFTLAVYPPTEHESKSERPLELIIVVDDLGLDSEPELAAASVLIERVLSECRPIDAFQLLTLTGRRYRPDHSVVPVSAEELLQVTEFLRGLQPAETTNVVNDLVGQSPESERTQIHLVVTDSVSAFNQRGHAGAPVNANRSPLIAAVENHQTVDILQELNSVRHPVLTELLIEAPEGSGNAVRFAAPSELLPGKPLFIHGRFDGGSQALIVRGMSNGEAVSYPATRTEIHKSLKINPLLSVLGVAWAQDRIKSLVAAEQSESVKAEITKLGKTYALVTPYTSFVVVDALSVPDAN